MISRIIGAVQAGVNVNISNASNPSIQEQAGGSQLPGKGAEKYLRK